MRGSTAHRLGYRAEYLGSAPIQRYGCRLPQPSTIGNIQKHLQKFYYRKPIAALRDYIYKYQSRQLRPLFQKLATRIRGLTATQYRGVRRLDRESYNAQDRERAPQQSRHYGG